MTWVLRLVAFNGVYQAGSFVALPNLRGNAYTNRLQDARVYLSQEEAQLHACGNEEPVHVLELLTPNLNHYRPLSPP